MPHNPAASTAFALSGNVRPALLTSSATICAVALSSYLTFCCFFSFPYACVLNTDDVDDDVEDVEDDNIDVDVDVVVDDDEEAMSLVAPQTLPAMRNTSGDS